MMVMHAEHQYQVNGPGNAAMTHYIWPAQLASSTDASDCS